MPKIFDFPIQTITWRERVLLLFRPSFIGADVASEKTSYIRTKELFGKLYIMEQWELPAKINGAKSSFMTFDEMYQKLFLYETLAMTYFWGLIEKYDIRVTMMAKLGPGWDRWSRGSGSAI